MVTHFAVVRDNKYGGHTYHTLCGRANSQSTDGMNSIAKEDEVTCRFCMKALIHQHHSAIGSLRARLADG